MSYITALESWRRNNVTICIEERGERSPITICSLPLCECGAGELGEACSIDIT